MKRFRRILKSATGVFRDNGAMWLDGGAIPTAIGYTGVRVKKQDMRLRYLDGHLFFYSDTGKLVVTGWSAKDFHQSWLYVALSFYDEHGRFDYDA